MAPRPANNKVSNRTNVKKENESRTEPYNVSNAEIKYHEEFLQSFEKSTEVYRYLRTRAKFLPIFLTRNLSYMCRKSGRCTGQGVSRSNFDMNEFTKRINVEKSYPPGPYLNISYFGYFNSNEKNSEDVNVETLVLMFQKNKRKNKSATVIVKNISTTKVATNPSMTAVRSKLTKKRAHVSIPQSSFIFPSNGSYRLYLKVGFESRDNEDDADINGGVPVKKSRLSNSCKERAAFMKPFPLLASVKLGNEMDVDEDVSADDMKESACQASRLNAKKAQYANCILIYKKEGDDARQPEPAGNYFVSLKKMKPNGEDELFGINAKWQTVDMEANDFERRQEYAKFDQEPKLSFHMWWSDKPCHASYEQDSFVIEKPERKNPYLNAGFGEERSKMKNVATNYIGVSGTTNMIRSLTVVYEFVYNNSKMQKTMSTNRFNCPWCAIRCGDIYALLKHLRLCHPRFNFSYTAIHHGVLISVSVNDKYGTELFSCPIFADVQGDYKDTEDEEGSSSISSYAEFCRMNARKKRKNKDENAAHRRLGYATGCIGPVKKTPAMKTLVCRAQRGVWCYSEEDAAMTWNNRRNSISEFIEDHAKLELFDAPSPIIPGHNRMYHHTGTCLPIYANEIDENSEDERDPKWLQKKTLMMIDDFTDVNDGEKELMKMWNLHVMKHNYVGDCQMLVACTQFLEERGQELLEKNLYRNFVLHLCSMFDFGLVNSVFVYGIVMRLHDLIQKYPKMTKNLRDFWDVQKVHWCAKSVSNGNGNGNAFPSIASASSSSSSLSSSSSSSSSSSCAGEDGKSDGNRKSIGKIVEPLAGPSGVRTRTRNGDIPRSSERGSAPNFAQRTSRSNSLLAQSNADGSRKVNGRLSSSH